MIDRVFIWTITVLTALVTLRDVLRYYVPLESERVLFATAKRRRLYVAACSAMNALLWLCVAKLQRWL